MLVKNFHLLLPVGMSLRKLGGFFNVLSFWNPWLPVSRKVEYSVKKYGQTYKLLEEYDRKAPQSAEKMVDAGRLQPYIRKLQKDARKFR